MSPSGSGSPLMGTNEEDPDNTELEYSVSPRQLLDFLFLYMYLQHIKFNVIYCQLIIKMIVYRYSSSYETVEALVLEAIKEQIQRRVAPDAIGKGFLKLLSATCGFPEVINI